MSFTICFLGCGKRSIFELENNFEISYCFPQLLIYEGTYSHVTYILPQVIIFGERFRPYTRRRVCLPSIVMSDDNNIGNMSVARVCYPFISLTIYIYIYIST